LVPYFTVPADQMGAFKALVPQFVARTQNESGCLHYAFSFSDTTAHCREGYENAEAVLAHLENVGDLLQDLLKIAPLIRLEVHASASDCASLKEPLAPLNPQFFVLEPGFRRHGGGG
jgi:quinol monooxygenase YgiN